MMNEIQHGLVDTPLSSYTRPNNIVQSAHQMESWNQKKHHLQAQKLEEGSRSSENQNICSGATLRYSATQFACPVWERSAHVKKLNPTLNYTCQLITGCLKLTNTNNLYVLAGIAPPDIRTAVVSQTERKRRITDIKHHLHGHTRVTSILRP